MSTVIDTSAIEQMRESDWYVNHDLLMLAAAHGISTGEFATPETVLDFFEKPHNYATIARLATAVSDMERYGPTFVARALPAYVKVQFAVNGSRVVTGLTRDLPQSANSQDRRITNLDSGTEFFVAADTEFDHFEIVEFDGKG